MTIIHNPDGLIGDFLGTIPIMIELAKRDPDGAIAIIHPEAKHLFDMIPSIHRINRLPDDIVAFAAGSEANHQILNISEAFRISHERNLFMSQAHFAYLGMPVPETPPKAELLFPFIEVPEFDYIIAPFSRSLPPNERWPQERWQSFVDSMPGSTFCIIGHDRDARNYIKGANVTEIYNEPIVKVCNLLKTARKGLISVVSGPSHLAFHLGVKNYLLTNQNMTWGNNPDAVKITWPIPALSANELINVINEN